MPLHEAELHVHDVLNVFMCTGFTRDTHQYFMKASPVRPGDFIEFFAEIDLLGALSACPGGDCGASHSERRGQMLSAQGRDLSAARGRAGRLAVATAEQIFPSSCRHRRGRSLMLHKQVAIRQFGGQ